MARLLVERAWLSGLFRNGLEDSYMPESSQTERRSAPRIGLQIVGSIRSRETRAPLCCVLRDFSETGARIQVDDVSQVPDVFWLHLEHEGFLAKCNVVWRTGRELGVIFARVGHERRASAEFTRSRSSSRCELALH